MIGYRFNLEQNTADNASAGQLVVGPRLPVTDLMALDTVAVRLHDGSGNTLGQGVGADADGHPLDAVARLAQELAANGQRLEAGDLVITGGLTKACTLQASTRPSATFSFGDAWSVEVAVWRPRVITETAHTATDLARSNFDGRASCPACRGRLAVAVFY